MSTQRLAIVTALATHNMVRNGSDADRLNRSYYERQERPNGTQFHGNVNYLLGGYTSLHRLPLFILTYIQFDYLHFYKKKY